MYTRHSLHSVCLEPRNTLRNAKNLIYGFQVDVNLP